jgi:hypothetical protein
VGTPLLAGQTVHVATEGGHLLALAADTGDEVATPFSLADGVLYAVTDGAVLALR